MSTQRAITQLIKSYSLVSKRLHVLEEEKAGIISMIEEKYKLRENDLFRKRSESHSALLALGLSPDLIEKAFQDLAAKSEGEAK